MEPGVHYSDYLQIDKILAAQSPESAGRDQPAHDEMLFIITHQAYELWFKQLLYEVASVDSILQKPVINDNAPELQAVVHRLNRCVTILKVLVHQIDIMETMAPMDFLDFRDLLRPASGFQSIQFKILEARLGLRYEQRFGQEYYLSQLRPAEVEAVRQAEAQPSLLDAVNTWLERMPFWAESSHWQGFGADMAKADLNAQVHPFWQVYRSCYRDSLSGKEQANLALFDGLLEGKPLGRLSSKAALSALFIMLYPGYPVLQLPYRLLQALLEIDEQLNTWRYRHMSMVQRIIGLRTGTGGSTGKDYLSSALASHAIFRDIAALTSFLIERRRLPALRPSMESRLGFTGHQG